MNNKTKIKVLHLNYFQNRGGASIATNRIIESLKKKIYIKKICYQIDNIHDKDLYYLPSKIDLLLRIIKLRFQFLLKKVLVCSQGTHSFNIFPSKLLKLINNSNFDLVHLHWVGNEMLSISDIAKINKPIIWTLHDMWPYTGSAHYSINMSHKKTQGFLDLDYYTFKRKLQFWTDKIFFTVSPSQWQLSKVNSSRLFRNKNNYLILHPLNFSKWYRESKVLLRKKLNIKKKELAFLFVSDGRINEERKGFCNLIKALNILYKKKNFKLLVLGNAKNDFIIDFKIEFPIIFLDHTNNLSNNKKNLNQIYSAVDLLLFPSNLEIAGLVIQEAAACEVPAVGFKNTGAASIISHKISGYLAKYNDYEDFILGIKWVLQNRNISFIKNMRKLVKYSFSYEKISGQYIKIYKKILKVHS